jgi:uncharacterized protein (DUF2141 family)
MYKQSAQSLSPLDAVDKKWAAQEGIISEGMAAAYHAILTRLYSLSQGWQMHFKQMYTRTNFAIRSDSSSIEAHDVSSGRAATTLTLTLSGGQVIGGR